MSAFAILACLGARALAKAPPVDRQGVIPPATPIPAHRAPQMEAKLVKDAPGEKVYAIVFHRGDEVLSGLTDFALAHQVGDAHFTGIGAVSRATVGWLDPAKKGYRPIHVDQQVEILSLVGDVATFQGASQIHMHVVLGKSDGSTVGGHVWELITSPTVEVFMTVNAAELAKRPDEASSMKFIDPTH